MKYIYLSTILALVLISNHNVYATEYNAGFVEGLWFKEQPIFADQTNRIYVAIRNHTGNDLTGRIVFYDNDKRLSSQAVSALDGRIIEAWTDWTPEYGEHVLRAELEKVTLDVVGGSDESIDVPHSSVSNEFFVDYDTDEDGVGNKIDKDDDNDGVSDEIEIKNGTDPLKPEPIEEVENNVDTNTETNEENDITKKDSNNDRTGLERYLSETQFKNALEKTTDLINNTSNNLDSYISQRKANQSDTSNQTTEEIQEENSNQNKDIDSSSSSSPQSIFGEVERKLDKGKNEFNWQTVKDFLKHNLNVTYTFLLTILSAFLYRPILVQILFLLLILYLIYRLAKKFGDRRN